MEKETDSVEMVDFAILNSRQAQPSQFYSYSQIGHTCKARCTRVASIPGNSFTTPPRSSSQSTAASGNEGGDDGDDGDDGDLSLLTLVYPINEAVAGAQDLVVMMEKKAMIGGGKNSLPFKLQSLAFVWDVIGYRDG